MEIDELINFSCPELREITFHSDGRVIAKTGGRAKYPKRLYSSGKVNVDLPWDVKTKIALRKLIEENKSEVINP